MPVHLYSIHKVFRVQYDGMFPVLSEVAKVLGN